MKLNEIIDLNKPQLKVEAHNKRGVSAGTPRVLLIKDIGKEDAPRQIKEIIQKISSKYITGNASIKLIDTAPLVFNIIPEDGADFYRFVISFPPGMDDVQKGLITSIERFMNPAE